MSLKKYVTVVLALILCSLLSACLTQEDIDAAYARGTNDAYQAAYEAGHADGYALGEQDAYGAAYEDGFRDGEDEGFTQGKTEAERFLKSREDAAYWRGYSEAQMTEDGYQYGYDTGYQSGYWAGHQEAAKEIRNELDEGDAWDWISEEYEDAIWETTAEARSESYDEGYDDGYADGYHDGRNAAS